ncbi:MAG TPA: hypothetical protein VK212_09860 [Lentimicrobium sp.]|nr:hypothetical protein [Lentimicrobium sp.]
MYKFIHRLLLLVLVFSFITSCKDDNDDNGDPNSQPNPLVGSWLYTSPTVTHSLIFTQNTLKSVQNVTVGPTANENVLEGTYMILSTATVVSFNVTSATQNDVEKVDWLGEKYYIAGLFSEDSLQFLEAVKWERITGNPEALTGGRFHRYTVTENNGETTYNHFRMDFSSESVIFYSTTTNSEELPSSWDTEVTRSLVTQDDHFYTGGDPSNQSYFRFDEGNLYLSDYLPHIVFKRL